MSRPFAKLYRDLADSGLFQNHKACALYCHLLCGASIVARRIVFNGSPIDIKPGQMVTSRSELAGVLGLTDKEIRIAIKTLEKLQLVGQVGASRYTLFSIIDSDTYQQQGPAEGPSQGQPEGQVGAKLGPSQGQPSYKEEECRMEKGDSREKTNSASGDAPSADARPKRKRVSCLSGKRLETFERFWKVYGLQKGRGGAEKAWAAIPVLTDELVNRICWAAEQEAAQRPALRARGLTPKWAQGWLNERRWEDEYAPASQAPVPRGQPQAQGMTFADMRNERNRQACMDVLNELRTERSASPQEDGQGVTGTDGTWTAVCE